MVDDAKGHDRRGLGCHRWATFVGDVAGNTQRILRAVGAAEAANAGITLLPELAITGYPPEDLLAREHFVEENLDALEMIAAACGNVTVVGFVDRDFDGNLFNAAAMFESKQNPRFVYQHYFLGDGAGADQCTKCGECLPKCPQSIAIPDRLEEAHAFLMSP